MNRVLVVDDKAENLYLLQALLTGHGYQVDSAQHGAEALVRARQAPPDVIVSDLLMPVMDGYTLLRHWKSDSRLARVPFVVYTATYTEPEDERLALSLGADAFILKPAEPEEFLARLRAVEGLARSGAAPRSPRPLEDQPDLLKVYSETLVRKLEEKTLELEEANRILQAEIAEKRRLAEHLEAQRARLAEAQAVAQVGSWATELPSLEVSWSEETHRIFGTDPATFHPTHRAFLDRLHPDDRSRVDAAFVASLDTTSDHAIEHRIVLADGGVKHLLERWRVIRGPDGAPVRASGTCQDVTAARQAQESLRESEERFRQLAETISEVFWISDPTKSRMLYVSPGYEAIWGRTVEELYAHPSTWLEAIHREDREAVRAALPRQLEGDYDQTYRVVRPDGGERWVRDRAFPVRGETGAVYRLVGLAEDITERKAIEARFLRAQRLESIGTLAGGIAHDLNNVLTPIMMSIDLLKADATPAERRETIATIEASARKGAEMVRQVLSFTRGVEGRRVEVDIGELLRDVERIVSDTFLKAIQLRTVSSPDLPTVIGDPTQLHQVLLNLCVNARDAMPDGGTITIEAVACGASPVTGIPSAGKQAVPGVAIRVTDTGTGMPPEVLRQIFEPFFTTKAPGKGTGLGLPTSLGIVKNHGGTLDVESAPGVGSTFRLWLPASGEARREAGSPERPAPPRGTGQLVLVVDDESTIREITRRTLEAFGYQVLVAADGAEAVAVFTAHRALVAAMVTDMMMPIMDGAATIRAIRALEPALPIVAVSGLALGGEEPGTLDQAHRPTRLLQKPYTTEELLAALHGALHRRS